LPGVGPSREVAAKKRPEDWLSIAYSRVDGVNRAAAADSFADILSATILDGDRSNDQNDGKTINN